MSDRAKIKNRRVAGNDLQQQREVANAIKVAREMALLPYANARCVHPHGRSSRAATEAVVAGAMTKAANENDTELVLDDDRSSRSRPSSRCEVEA